MNSHLAMLPQEAVTVATAYLDLLPPRAGFELDKPALADRSPTGGPARRTTRTTSFRGLVTP